MPNTRAVLVTAALSGLPIIAMAPAAEAAAVCDGAYVKTCINLVEEDGYYVRGTASIRDTDIGSNYSVSVTSLVLQEKVSPTADWRFSGFISRDEDGFQPVVDEAKNGRQFCQSTTFNQVTWRAKATMKWTKVGSGITTTQSVYSRPVTLPCYPGHG